MLDFDGATKRFGPLTALDGCTFAARPAGWLAGWGSRSQRRREDNAMRVVFGLVELDLGMVRWRGAAIAPAYVPSASYAAVRART